MKTYTRTTEVQAVQVVHTVGTKIITDEEGTEIDLGNEFATRHNYKPGDYVVFEGGKPISYMNADLFEASFNEVKELVPDARTLQAMTQTLLEETES